MLVRRKNVEKSRVGLWGQSLLLKVAEANYRVLGKGYLRRVLTGGGF